MDDQAKTKQQLMDELKELRQSGSKLEPMQEALRKIEDRLQLALKGADLGLWDYNLKTGAAFINERRAEMVGYSVDELGPHMSSWGKLVHPDDIDRVTSAFNAHVQGRTPLYESEHRLRHKSGLYIWILARAKVVEWDKQGNPVRIVGTSLDITDRKRAEEALRQAHDELERRVQERTAELRDTNEQLREQIAERRQAEEALRHSGEILSLALDGANLGIWDWDLTTGKALWSERNQRVLGYEPGEFEPNLKNWKKLIHPDDWPLVSENLNLHIQGKLPMFESEYRILNKPGDWLWVQALGKVIAFDADGKPIRMAGVVADITERKRAEEALREREESYRDLVENIEDLICTHDLQGNLLFVNQAPAKVLGYAPADLIGTNLRSYLAPEVREQFDVYLAAIQSDGRASGLMLVQTKSGEKRVWDYRNTLRKEGPGAPIVHGLARDITERERAEAAIRQQRDFLQQLIDTIPTPIFYKNVEGRYLGCNTAFESDTGMSRADIVGKTVVDVAPRDLAQIDREADLSLLRNPGVQQGENRRQDAAGNLHEVMFTKATFSDLQGNIAGLVGVIFDITERKRAEEALRESEKRYRELVEKANDIIYLTDTNGQFLVFNAVGLKITGYSQEDIVRKHYLDLIHPDYREQVGRFYGLQFVKRIPDTYNEVPIITNEGKTVWIGQNVQLVVEGDSVLGFQSIARDITDRKKAEESLRKSEERLQLALQGGNLGMWDLHIPTGHAVTNQRTAEIVGYSLDEIEESFSFWESLLHPEDRWRALEKVSDHVAALTDYFEEDYRVRHKNGGWRWIHARGKITERDPDGKPLRMTGTFMDITDRKDAEKELLESEARFKQVADSLDEWVWEVDANGMYRYCSSAAERILGYSPDELVGQKHFYDLFAPEVREDLKQAAMAAFSRREPIRNLVNPNVHKNGDIVIIETSGTPIEDEQGNLLGYRGADTDITERKKAEEESRQAEERLVESERRYRHLVQNASDIIYSTDVNGSFTFVNPVGLKISGYSTEEVIGQSFLRIVPEEYRQDVQRFYGAQFVQKIPDTYREFPFLTKQGNIVWLGQKVHLVVEGDRVSGFQTVARDITEQTSLQKQLLQAQKMQAVGTLAGGIAHDFNNLLTVVIGFSELLLAEKEQDDPEYADLQKIFHAAKSGADLVQRLLMFGRKAEPKPVPMNLNKQIVQVEKLLRRTIPRMVDIQLELSADLPDINADPSQVEQVLMNLSINARDAMPDVGKLTVRTSLVTLDEEYCRLHVEANPGEYVSAGILGHGPWDGQGNRRTHI